MIEINVLDKLRQIDTATICNVIELFDVRPFTVGYMDQSIKSCFHELPPIVGFASTATYRSAAPHNDISPYDKLLEQIDRFEELSGPAVIIFQDLDVPTVAATFGDIMCNTYKAFGAVGLITSGAGRDLDQIREIEFPVFTNGTNCSHGYGQIPQICVQIKVGGMVINPNDLIHGDHNGITTIPLEIASEVADVADDFVAAEARILETVKSDNPSKEKCLVARDEFANSIEKIKKEISCK